MNLIAYSTHPRKHIQGPAAILVHAGASSDAEALVRAASDIANQFGAKLFGISTPPQIASLPMSDAEEDATELILKNAAGRFAKLSTSVRAGASWRVSPGAPAVALQRFAWAADLIMLNLGDADGGKGRDASLRSLVTLGKRPVLVRPRGAGPAEFKRVAVVWDGSPACGRALSAALPFLGRAEQVYVMTDGRRPTSRLRESLGHLREGLDLRGIRIQTYIDRDVERESEAVTPEDVDADLIVMGAWRRPPWLAFTDPTNASLAALRSFTLLSH